MKSFIALFSSVLFVSIFSMTTQAACPSYSGKYLCSGDGIDQEINLKTEMVGDQYQYTLDDAVVLADGVTRPVNFQGGIYDISATCAEDNVTVKVLFPGGEGDNEACGADKWDLLYTLMFSPNGANIAETHYSDAVCGNGTVVPSDEKGSLNCVPVAP